MALFTRCILLPPTAEDGIRLSVMSRHTLNDGITPDPRIQAFDTHVPMLAPSLLLVGSYYKRGLDWGMFERSYLEEIQEPRKARLVRILASLAIEYNITLLCIEETAEYCHRRLLAEECLRQQSQLIVLHR